MKTDELVALLANGDVGIAPHALERRLLVGISAGSLAAVVLMLVMLGVRPDLLAAAHQPMFWVKSLFAASLALAALVTAARLSRPGVLLGRAPVAVVSPVLTMWALGALALLAAAPGQRANLLFGDSWNACPLAITLLALPIFVGTLWAMGGLAPTRLRLAGATSGLLSGAIATLVYCLHCPEMAAPFVAVWYVLGMALPTALGALLGPRLLRW